MAGWWQSRRCGAKTRKGGRCIAQAMRNGRCRNHGGMCTGPNTEAGKRRRAVATRIWWAMWDPKARSRPRLQLGRSRRCDDFSRWSSPASSDRASCDDHARGRFPIPRAWPALRQGCDAAVQPSARRRRVLQTTADQPITVSGEILALCSLSQKVHFQEDKP